MVLLAMIGAESKSGKTRHGQSRPRLRNAPCTKSLPVQGRRRGSRERVRLLTLAGVRTDRPPSGIRTRRSVPLHSRSLSDPHGKQPGGAGRIDQASS
jgi:hypothetical protein